MEADILKVLEKEEKREEREMRIMVKYSSRLNSLRKGFGLEVVEIRSFEQFIDAWFECLGEGVDSLIEE